LGEVGDGSASNYKTARRGPTHGVHFSRKVSPEQIIATLRQIEVQLAQGMSLALACKEAGISESPAEKELSNFSRLCFTPLAQETETW
jgi:hypothetical protein